MAHSIQVVAGRGLVITYTGTLTDSEFVDIDREILTLATSGPEPAWIMIDTTDLADNRVSADTVRQSAGRARQLGLENQPQVDIFFVMPGDVDFGLARVWQGFFENPHANTRIYRSREQAMADISTLQGELNPDESEAG